MLLTLAGVSGCSNNGNNPNGAEESSLLCPEKTSQGACIIDLGVSGVNAVRFEADLADMQRLPDGSIQVSNKLVLVVPKVRWELAEAGVTFKRAADGKHFDRIEGEARIPFDKVPILDKAKTGGGLMVALGYDQGKNLDNLDAPLNPETHYLFFAFKENFSVSFGFNDLGIPVRGGESASRPFKFSPIPEAHLVMVLDPSDPFFYVSAAGLKPKKDDGDKKKKDDDKKKSSLSIGGFGFSYHNRIPEEIDILDFKKSMRGTLLLEGSVPFPPLPAIKYSGYYLVGDKGLSQAINGDITVGFPLELWTSITLSLGKATAIAEVDGEHAELLIAGHFQPDTSSVPAAIPIIPQPEMQMALQLNTADRGKNLIYGKGKYELAGSQFAPKGMQFGNIYSEQGEFRITLQQIEMNGGVDSDLSPFQFKAGTHFNAMVKPEGEGSRLTIDGNILIGPLDSRGKLTIQPAGVILSADINATSDWQMALEGHLHKLPNRGLRLSGSFNVPAYLNDRIAAEVTKQVNQTSQDLQGQIDDLTRRLNQLILDLPHVRNDAHIAASTALKGMDTGREGSLVNREIEKQCKGTVVPGCAAAARAAFNRSDKVKRVKEQLNHLIKVLNQKDDASNRAALKAALQQVIDSDPVDVNLVVHRVSFHYLNTGEKVKLHTALNHIELLKSTGGRRVDAQQQLEKFSKGTLSQIAKQIKQGANPVKVKSIGFDMPAAASGPLQVIVQLMIDGKPNARPVAFNFDPEQPQQLPLKIVRQIGKDSG